MREEPCKPRQALVQAGRPPLGGAGFPCQSGVAEAGAPAGAVALAHHVIHPLAHNLRGGFIDSEPVLALRDHGFNHAPPGVLDLAYQRELRQRSAITNSSHHLRDLERRGEKTSLAD